MLAVVPNLGRSSMEANNGMPVFLACFVGVELWSVDLFLEMARKWAPGASTVSKWGPLAP